MMDWNYRMTAKAINFEIDRVQGDNMNHFPIERARLRLSEIIVLLRAASVIGYGWSLQLRTVGFKPVCFTLKINSLLIPKQHVSVPLIMQFFIGFLGVNQVR